MKKRLLAIVFVFCMLFNLAFAVSANGDTVVKVLVEERVETNDTNGYVTNTNPDNSEKDKIIPFNNKDYYVFEVTIPESGFYTIGMRCGVHNTYPLKTQVSLFNGAAYEVLLETQLKGTGGYTRITNQDIGTVELSKGTHKIKFLNTYSDAYLAYVTFTLLPSFKVSEAKANDEIFSAEDTIYRGTDKIDILLNQNIKTDTVSQDTVYLMGNEKVKANVSVSGNTITLKLKETLDFDTDYVINIKGVQSDNYTSDLELPFTTSSENADKGTASLGDITASISSGVVNAEGVMRGSHGLPIEGRNAYLYLVQPDGTEIDDAVATGVTDENGMYSLEYTLPESAPSGEYTIIVGGEYISSIDRKSVKSRYISLETEEEIVDNFSNATDDVLSLLNQYKDALDIDPTTTDDGDLAGIEDVEMIFDNFNGKTFNSAAEVRDCYYSSIYAVQINEASSVDSVEEILNDLDKCVLLGLEREKCEAISEYFDDFALEVYNLEKLESVSNLQFEMSKIVDVFVAKVFGIDQVSFVLNDAEIFEDEKLSVDLNFEEELENVKYVTLELESDMFLDNNVIGLENIPTENIIIASEGNKAYVTLNTVDAISKLSSLGTFYVDTVTEGKYNVNFAAQVVLLLDGMEVSLEAKEDDFFVTAHPKKDGFVYESAEASILEYLLEDRVAWNCKEGVQSTNGISHIGLHSGEWHEFKVDIPENGKYNFVINSGVGSKSYSPKVQISGAFDGAKEYKNIVSGEMVYTGAWTTFEDHYIGTADMQAGSYIIRITSTYADSYFVGLKVIPDTKLGVKDIKIGETSLLFTDRVKRGSDVFEFAFNENLNNTSVSAQSVKIFDGNKELLSTVSSSKNTITVHLNESLDYNKEYSILVNGISNIFNTSTIAEQSYNFATLSEDDDEGVASVIDVEGKMIYEEATIFGKIVGSAGQPIANRNVYLYVKDTNSQESDVVKTVITDENGCFELVYSIDENSPAGVYTFLISSDYVELDDRVKCNLTYITKAQGEEFLESLNNTQNTDAVIALLNTNKEMLALDINADIENALIEDENAFYNHFVGKDLNDIPEFFDMYNKALVTETINQATEKDVIEDVFANVDKLALLGIDAERFNLLTDREVKDENGELFTAGKREVFLNEVFDLVSIDDVDELIDTVNDLFEKNLAKEYLKENSVFSASDVTVNVGYSAAIPLTFEESIIDVKKVIIRVKAQKSEYLYNAEIDKIANGNFVYNVDGDTLEITFEPERSNRSLSEIATLYLSPAQTTGTSSVELSGDVVYAAGDSGEFLKAPIVEKEITITVNKKQSGNSSSSSGGGTQTRVPTGSSRPVVTPPPTETPAEPTVAPTEAPDVQPFDDINEVEWAKESIQILYDAGVVSPSENNKFNPNNAVKREELVKMLVVSLGLKVEGDNTFIDVSKDAWYYAYLSAAQNNGIVTGDDLGNFGVGQNLTRQDLCVMIARALTNGEYKTETDHVEFADDEQISEYAKEAVYWLKSKNMINGVGDNNFAPKDTVTRAMAAKLIASVLSYVEGEVK